MGSERLTKAQRDLLEIIRVYTDDPDGFVPRFDRAHPRNQVALEAMKARGLVRYTWRNQVMTITPAGRSLLSTETDDAK